MFRAPRGRTPALGSGQGVYRRDRAIQTAYIRNTRAPVPRPVSHLTAAAAAARDRFLRLPKAINDKYEITFVRVRDSSITNPKVRPKVISNLVFIALGNLRHRSRADGGRGVHMRHGVRRRGVTIAK